MNRPRLVLTELREYRSERTGATYFAGYLGKARVVMLRDDRAECTARKSLAGTSCWRSRSLAMAARIALAGPRTAGRGVGRVPLHPEAETAAHGQARRIPPTHRPSPDRTGGFRAQGEGSAPRARHRSRLERGSGPDPVLRPPERDMGG